MDLACPRRWRVQRRGRHCRQGRSRGEVNGGEVGGGDEQLGRDGDVALHVDAAPEGEGSCDPVGYPMRSGGAVDGGDARGGDPEWTGCIPAQHEI